MLNHGKLLLILIFLSVSRDAGAQSPAWQLKGKVESESHQPLRYASVSLEDKGGRTLLTTVTDTAGSFIMNGTNKGSFTLLVKLTGYNDFKTSIELPGGKAPDLIILAPNIQSVGEVIIESKKDLIQLDAGNIIYNVAKSIDAQGASAFDALKKAPGVFIENDNTITLYGKAGTLILVDGKQTYMSGEELARFLKSMPASGLRAFEIISTPTAKYEATGSAGIINIKTLKQQLKGLNGTATTGFAYGTNARQNQDISLNYRKDRLNVFGSYNHFLGYNGYLYGTDRLQNDITYNSYTDDTDKKQKMGGRLGADYTINKNHTLGLLATGNFIFGGGITDTKTNIGFPAAPDQVLDAVNDYYEQHNYRYFVNLNYKYEDSAGRILNLDADHGDFTYGVGTLQSNLYSDLQHNVLNESRYRTLNGSDIILNSFKADYSSTLLKGRLETGVKFSGIKAENYARFYHAIKPPDSLDQRRSNTFGFDEKISSGYVNYKYSLKKWIFQAGLRVEHSASVGNLLYKINGSDSASQTRRNATGFFPSLSISVKPGIDHSLSLAYSRRIDRPAYQDLNPFTFLLDELSFWQGNPYLLAQLSHRATLQYAFRSSTIVGVTYAYTDFYSTRITDTIGMSKIIMIPKNLGVQKNLSLSVTRSVSPAQWWDITFNGILYRLRNQITFDQYRNFDLKQLAGRLNLQQTFKLPFKVTGELSAFYNSKRLSGANEISRATSQLDVGFQKKLLKNRAVLRFVYNDIYQGSGYSSLKNFNGFYLRSYGQNETRQVRFNFTYNFADSSVKGPRTRNSGLENENGRIK